MLQLPIIHLETEEKAKLEAEANATEVEEAAKLLETEAEARAKAEGEEKVRLEAKSEAKALAEAEENARLEAVAKAQAEAEEKARLEAEAEEETQLEATTSEIDTELKYKLASTDYVNEDLFQIDQAGRVIISGRLDRETKAVHQLTFLAETKTSPTLNSYFTLTVQVLDSNDKAPEFQSDPYDIMVSEALAPGTDVVQVQALDPDFGANGEIRYHLEQPHSLFEIDTNSGWIKVFNELDAEKEVSHELKVKAEDGNGLSALATVRIHVQDVNDNPHQFTQLHYNAAVNEGALPGTIIFQLMTADADKVAKTRVDYYIRDGDSKAQFGIKSNGEVYVSRPLDRELKSIYKLKVVASDGAFVNEAKVTIEILDDNDNAPVCVQDKYWLKISEDTSPGFFLGQIQVTGKTV
jgi:hypothetical protein